MSTLTGRDVYEAHSRVSQQKFPDLRYTAWDNLLHEARDTFERIAALLNEQMQGATQESEAHHA